MPFPGFPLLIALQIRLASIVVCLTPCLCVSVVGFAFGFALVLFLVLPLVLLTTNY